MEDLNINIKGLKPLLERLGSVLVVEDGQPTCVVLGIDTFRKLAAEQYTQPTIAQEQTADVPVTVERGPQRKPADAREAEVMERLNSEIQALKDQLIADQERVERSLEDLWPTSEGTGNGQAE